MASLQSSVSEGRNPMSPIAHGAFILVAGVLLLTPGFFTDALGLSFLIPGVRSYLIKNVGAQLMSKATVHTFGMPPGANPHDPNQTADADVVDAEFEVIDEGQQKPRN